MPRSNSSQQVYYESLNRPDKDFCWNFLHYFCSVTLFFLVIGLAYFAFFSDDPSSCYYMPGLNTPFTRQDDLLKMAKALSIPVKEGYPVEMARVFRIWFVWGFWTTFAPSALYMVLAVMQWSQKHQVLVSVLTVARRVLCGLLTGGIVAWGVVGALWRFSRPGQVVAGDLLNIHYWGDYEKVQSQVGLHGYQIEGGRFMRDVILNGFPLFSAIMLVGLVSICLIEATEEQKTEEEKEAIASEKLRADLEVPRYQKIDIGKSQKYHTFDGVARSDRDSLQSAAKC